MVRHNQVPCSISEISQPSAQPLVCTFAAGGRDQVPLPALRRPRRHQTVRRRERQAEDVGAGGQQPRAQHRRLPRGPRERPGGGARRRIQAHPQDGPGAQEDGAGRPHGGRTAAQKSRKTGTLEMITLIAVASFA